MESTPGAALALTFDDAYVSEWFAALPLLERHGARVTFYLSYVQRLSVREISLVQHLAMAGHEIGYHSISHLNAVTTSAEIGIDEYIALEITPGLATMETFGFSPRAFAYPYNARTPDLDTALLRYFKTLRSRTQDTDELLHPLAGNAVLYGQSIDSLHRNGEPIRSIEDAFPLLDRAAQTGRAAVLYGHGVSDEHQSYPHLTWAGLEAILSHAQRLGLRFLTASELA